MTWDECVELMALGEIENEQAEKRRGGGGGNAKPGRTTTVTKYTLKKEG